MQYGLRESPAILQIVEFNFVHNKLPITILFLGFSYDIVQQAGERIKARKSEHQLVGRDFTPRFAQFLYPWQKNHRDQNPHGTGQKQGPQQTGRQVQLQAGNTELRR